MTIVVYRKRKNSKPSIAVFTERVSCDDIVNMNKRKPVIPYDWIIDELGMGGERMLAAWATKYKVKISQKNYNPIF